MSNVKCFERECIHNKNNGCTLETVVIFNKECEDFEAKNKEDEQLQVEAQQE